MGFQRLSQNAAFGPGCDVWILADRDHNIWTSRIDWYMNFQLSKIKTYQPPESPEGLEKIMNSNNIKPSVAKPKEPLIVLVGSQSRLPTKQIIEVSFERSAQSWIQRCDQIWQDLNKPSIRLFTPKKVSAEDLIKHWSRLESGREIGYVSS